jgi:hypothetical protein
MEIFHMTDSLKACPFCRRTDSLILLWASEQEGDDWDESNDDCVQVICDASTDGGKGGCGSSSGFRRTIEEAKTLWNTRADSGEAVAHWDAWGIASHVRAELDKQSCPDHWMRVAVDTVVKHLEEQPRAMAVDAFAIAKAFTAGFKEACEWSAPVVQDTDSAAFGSSQRLYVEAAIASREGE